MFGHRTLFILIMVVFVGLVALMPPDSPEPIRRGIKLLAPETHLAPQSLPDRLEAMDDQPPATNSDAEAAVAELDPEDGNSEERPDSAADDAHISEEVRALLDMTVPDLALGTDTVASGSSEVLLPDLFKGKRSDPGVDLSGRIHWDESDEARDRPVKDTIRGAEVEVRIPLP